MILEDYILPLCCLQAYTVTRVTQWNSTTEINLNAFTYSFYLNVIRVWNNLPSEVVMLPSLYRVFQDQTMQTKHTIVTNDFAHVMIICVESVIKNLTFWAMEISPRSLLLHGNSVLHAIWETQKFLAMPLANELSLWLGYWMIVVN